MRTYIERGVVEEGRTEFRDQLGVDQVAGAQVPIEEVVELAQVA